jgi:hypothetical protein
MWIWSWARSFMVSRTASMDRAEAVGSSWLGFGVSIMMKVLEMGLPNPCLKRQPTAQLQGDHASHEA